MDALKYGDVWKQDVSLDDLNRHIHDGAPLEQLANRGRGLRDRMYSELFPGAKPPEGGRVLEFGSGVGWIMQAMLEGFELKQMVGLDISQNMVRRARERFQDPRASFVVYDGETFPFPSDTFDGLYSLSVVHHIEKHVAFLLFREMYRVLKPGGHAVIQVLSIHHLPFTTPPFEVECANHIRNREVYWHHYYSFDELVVLFSELIGVDELDIVPAYGTAAYFVHFGKGTGRRFLRPEIPMQTWPERVKALAAPAAPRTWWQRLWSPSA